jgi:hypothetical protein
MMAIVGCDRGHSLGKTGGREFRGVVIAVTASIAGFFAVLLRSCARVIAMLELLFYFFIKNSYDHYDRYDHASEFKESSGHSLTIAVKALA